MIRPLRGQRGLGFRCWFSHIGLPLQFIRDIYAAKRAARQPVISFEFFPPRTDDGDHALLEKHIPALLRTKPDYCSVTYGAGGSTRENTLMIVDRIQKQHGLTALAHLTCLNHTREQVADLLEKTARSAAKIFSHFAAIPRLAVNSSPRLVASSTPRNS